MSDPKYHNSTLAERASGGNPLGSIEGDPNNSSFGSRGKSTPKKDDKSVESDDEGVDDKRVRRGGASRK